MMRILKLEVTMLADDSIETGAQASTARRYLMDAELDGYPFLVNSEEILDVQVTETIPCLDSGD